MTRSSWRPPRATTSACSSSATTRTSRRPSHDLTGARVDFKKGGVAGVRMRGAQRGELIVLLRPRELVLIGAASG